MTDREKVIKGLTEISEYARAKADIAGIGKGKEVFDSWYRAAEDALALLREQEPGKPTWRRGLVFCGKCGRNFGRGFKYCPDCGRAVKWDAPSD